MTNFFFFPLGTNTTFVSFEDGSTGSVSLILDAGITSVSLELADGAVAGFISFFLFLGCSDFPLLATTMRDKSLGSESGASTSCSPNFTLCDLTSPTTSPATSTVGTFESPVGTSSSNFDFLGKPCPFSNLESAANFISSVFTPPSVFVSPSSSLAFAVAETSMFSSTSFALSSSSTSSLTSGVILF